MRSYCRPRRIREGIISVWFAWGSRTAGHFLTVFHSSKHVRGPIPTPREFQQGHFRVHTRGQSYQGADLQWVGPSLSRPTLILIWQGWCNRLRRKQCPVSPYYNQYECAFHDISAVPRPGHLIRLFHQNPRRQLWSMKKGTKYLCKFSSLPWLVLKYWNSFKQRKSSIRRDGGRRLEQSFHDISYHARISNI